MSLPHLKWFAKWSVLQYTFGTCLKHDFATFEMTCKVKNFMICFWKRFKSWPCNIWEPYKKIFGKLSNEMRNDFVMWNVVFS